jgi:hypothetical protein
MAGFGMAGTDVGSPSGAASGSGAAWKAGLDGWKPGIDAWKPGIDAWKAGIDVW